MRADEIASTDKMARLTLTSTFPVLPVKGRFLYRIELSRHCTRL